MCSLPAISVLLPVSEAASHLPDCIDSLARQTRTDFEVVAVDDGSTEESRAILERAARDDDRIRGVARPHRGLVAALNAGLELCLGELVARIDADERPALLRSSDRSVVLVAVSSRGARALIRRQLDSLGLSEGRDYWCVA